MPANLRLVAHPAQRHAHEGAAEGAGDRAAERRLPHAGRAHEAEDRALELADEREHRDVVEDAVLHIGEPEVVLVEHELRTRDIHHVIAALRPGERHDPVEIIARHGGLRRHRRRAAQLAELAVGALAHRGRKLLLLERRRELLEAVAFVLAELPVDRLELLLEVELALILEEGAANLSLDLALQTQNLDLGIERVRELREERADVRGLEVFLALVEPHEHVRGDCERLLLSRLRTLHERDDLRGEPAVQRDVLLEERHDAPRHRPFVRAARGLVEREGRHDGAQHLLRRRIPRDLRARDPLHEHLRRAVRQARHLEHTPRDAHAKEIGGGRILRVRRPLRDEEDPPVAGKRGLDGRERRRPPYEQRHHHVREDHDIAERQHRKSLVELELLFVAREGDRHALNIPPRRRTAPSHGR